MPNLIVTVWLYNFSMWQLAPVSPFWMAILIFSIFTFLKTQISGSVDRRRCVCVWGLKCSCRLRWRCVRGEWWDGSGTKPALSLPSQSGKPRQIILELTATKIEWAWFPLFCVCVHALPFFLVSVCLSHSLPLSFPPAVIFVLFAHSPNPILAWLLAYLLYYQASVFLGKWTCECRCVRECVRVWMFSCERVTAPHWFVKKSAPNSKSTIGAVFLPGLSTNFCLPNVFRSIQ